MSFSSYFFAGSLFFFSLVGVFPMGSAVAGSFSASFYTSVAPDFLPLDPATEEILTLVKEFAKRIEPAEYKAPPVW